MEAESRWPIDSSKSAAALVPTSSTAAGKSKLDIITAATSPSGQMNVTGLLATRQPAPKRLALDTPNETTTTAATAKTAAAAVALIHSSNNINNNNTNNGGGGGGGGSTGNHSDSTILGQQQHLNAAILRLLPTGIGKFQILFAVFFKIRFVSYGQQETDHV
jgi:hypothetical protein